MTALKKDQVIVDDKVIQLFPGRSAPCRKRNRQIEMSNPVRACLRAGILRPGLSHFDYGCGHGVDVSELRNLGYASSGWDPYHQPDVPKVPADVVTNLFVIDGIADPDERRAALLESWALADRYLVVAGRAVSFVGEWWPYGDGYISKRSKVFQMVLTMDKLLYYVGSVLGQTPHVLVSKPWAVIVARDQNQMLQDVVDHLVQTRVPVRLEERIRVVAA